MPEPYVGEIRMFAGNFPPNGWAFCNGATIPISENDTLFNLIGTTYGGDGQNTFNLPDLQGRLPVHAGTNAGRTFTMGEAAGVEQVTLTTQQIPNHTHPLLGSTGNGSQASPSNSVLASSTVITPYDGFDSPTAAMAPTAISAVGGSQPHENMQPFLCINFIISLYGVYPSPT